MCLKCVLNNGLGTLDVKPKLEHCYEQKTIQVSPSVLSLSELEAGPYSLLCRFCDVVNFLFGV